MGFKKFQGVSRGFKGSISSHQGGGRACLLLLRRVGMVYVSGCNWTEEEDAALCAWHAANGPSWTKLWHSNTLPGRAPRGMKIRWCRLQKQQHQQQRQQQPIDDCQLPIDNCSQLPAQPNVAHTSSSLQELLAASSRQQQLGFRQQRPQQRPQAAGASTSTDACHDTSTTTDAQQEATVYAKRRKAVAMPLAQPQSLGAAHTPRAGQAVVEDGDDFGDFGDDCDDFGDDCERQYDDDDDTALSGDSERDHEH